MLSAELVYVFVSFTAFLTFVVIGRSTIVSIPVQPPRRDDRLAFLRTRSVYMHFHNFNKFER